MGRKATYLRAWREAGGAMRKPGGYTLNDMVGRLAELGVPTTVATLSRIERGIHPYSQDILEAIADALGVSVAALVEDDPTKPDAEVVDFLRHLDEQQQQQAAAVLKAMFGK
jgi:transcriptional regulator with XRE-family HTH domain